MRPDFATHYYLPGRRPFLNLSNLNSEGVRAVEQEMAQLRAAGNQFRPFGRRYVEWRKLTEERLRQLFIARGGRPQRTAPHYLVLGESPWFEHLAAGMRALRVPLRSLPRDVTSATRPDSFAAMEFGPRFGYPQEAKPYHGRVFLLDELNDLIAEFGVPAPSWEEHHEDWRQWPDDAYVEIQLWSDDPVREHLAP